MLEDEEKALRDDLKYYFMSPCEKYRARGQIPWKLGVQILKIIMITTQVGLASISHGCDLELTTDLWNR